MNPLHTERLIKIKTRKCACAIFTKNNHQNKKNVCHVNVGYTRLFNGHISPILSALNNTWGFAGQNICTQEWNVSFIVPYCKKLFATLCRNLFSLFEFVLCRGRQVFVIRSNGPTRVGVLCQQIFHQLGTCEKIIKKHACAFQEIVLPFSLRHHSQGHWVKEHLLLCRSKQKSCLHRHFESWRPSRLWCHILLVLLAWIPKRKACLPLNAIIPSSIERF